MSSEALAALCSKSISFLGSLNKSHLLLAFFYFSVTLLWFSVSGMTVKNGGGSWASHHPDWNGRQSTLGNNKQREKKSLMLIAPLYSKHLLYCTVQFQTKAHLFAELTVRERGYGGEKVGKQMREERETKHRGNHCLLQNTATVMHQDLAPCLHHSFHRSILYIHTHAALCLCGRKSTCGSASAVHRENSDDREERINIPVKNLRATFLSLKSELSLTSTRHPRSIFSTWSSHMYRRMNSPSEMYVWKTFIFFWLRSDGDVLETVIEAVRAESIHIHPPLHP